MLSQKITTVNVWNYKKNWDIKLTSGSNLEMSTTDCQQPHTTRGKTSSKDIPRTQWTHIMRGLHKAPFWAPKDHRLYCLKLKKNKGVLLTSGSNFEMSNLDCHQPATYYQRKNILEGYSQNKMNTNYEGVTQGSILSPKRPPSLF